MAAELLTICLQTRHVDALWIETSGRHNNETTRDIDTLTTDEHWQAIEWVMRRELGITRAAIAHQRTPEANHTMQRLPLVPEPNQRYSIPNLRWLCNLPLVRTLRERIDKSQQPFPTATFQQWLTSIDHTPLSGGTSFGLDLIDRCMEEHLWPAVLSHWKLVTGEVHEHQPTLFTQLAHSELGHIRALLAADALDRH